MPSTASPTRRLPGLAAALGSLALAGCWPMPAANPDRTGHNPFESTLTDATVGDLTEQWRWTSPSYLGPPGDPVTSAAGGVHLTAGCGLITLDPATGTERWTGAVAGLECDVATPHQGEPYVVDGADGPAVVASYGESFVRSPGYLAAGWSTRTFDAASGTPSAGTSRFVVAARDGATLSSTRVPAAPVTTADVVAVDGRSFTLHATPTAATDPVATLTLGVDLVFHAGHAVASTVPGQEVFGDGVRAYARATGTGGCGPVRVATSTVPVACPAWFTATDGPGTRPVLHEATNTLLTRTTAGTLYALDAATGAVRWTTSGHGSGAAPVVVGDRVWLGTGTGQVQGFSVHGCGAPTCGPSLPWHLDTGTGQPVVAVSAAGDHLVFASSAGQVFALAGCTQGACTPLWQGEGSGSPVVSGGRLYVTDGRDLVAYGLPQPQPPARPYP